MATALSTLKNWFKTGLKPTQEQFWNWMDSFWHKDENIPQEKIEGLPDTLSGKADSTALTTKADLVGGKVPLSQLPLVDDVLEFATFSEFPAVGEAGKLYIDLSNDKPYLWDSETNQYKAAGVDEARLVALETGKVNKPGHDGNWILQKLGNIFTWMDASEFGKNMANSALVTAAAGKITQGANYIWDAANYMLQFVGLPDKSTDATFNRMMTQNSAGQVAWSNGKQVIINMPATLTDAEKTTWKTQMNGGWTTNTMSVAVITPPVVDKQDKNHWLSFKGANLNLNPANFSVQIMDSTGTNVVATVPNSQVQLYTNGIDLTFYYNFKDLPIGTYRFRLNNGITTYTTGENVSLTVVQLLQYQDLSATSWSKKLWNNNTTSILSSGSGNSAVYIPDPSVKSLANDGSFVCALLSQQIIPENQDFQIEFTISVTSNTGGKLASYIAGLVPSASSVELTNQTNFGVSLKSHNLSIAVEYFRDNDISFWIRTNTNQNSATFKVIATRRGGIITSLYQGLTSVAFSQKSYTNSALKIGLYTQNTANEDLNVGLNINSLVFF